MTKTHTAKQPEHAEHEAPETIEALTKKVNALSGFVKRLDEKVERHSKNWTAFARTHVGKPTIVGALLLCVLALPSFGANEGIIHRWYEGHSTYGTSFITNSATGKSRLVIDEVQAGSVIATVEVVSASSLSLTNDQAFAPAASVIAIDTAGANTRITNTLSAATAANVGRFVTLINVGTNDFVLRDTGNANLVSDVVLGRYGVVPLYIQATNRYVQVSLSGSTNTSLGTLTVAASATFNDTITVAGNSILNGNATVAGATVVSNMVARGAIGIAGAVTVTGVFTHVSAPNVTLTTNAGSGIANALVNLPGSAQTNAVYIRYTITNTAYAIPAFQL